MSTAVAVRPSRIIRPPPAHRERGSATIVAVTGIAVIMLVIGSVVAIGSATVTRRRAEAAADLAALAAATSAVSGTERACARARWVAQRMRAELTSCRLSGWDALVEILVQPPDLLLGLGSATARARAGPVDK
ncbi:MAG: Rv3654c family TadE-like protein [Labedaea sp.]